MAEFSLLFLSWYLTVTLEYRKPAGQNRGSQSQVIMSHQLSIVCRFSAFIAIGIHQKLRVTVEGEEGPDVSMILNKVDNRFNFHL